VDGSRDWANRDALWFREEANAFGALRWVDTQDKVLLNDRVIGTLIVTG
jgi:hypothetical protein